MNRLDSVHILVVDNNDSDRFSLITLLESEGAICHVARTRTEAMGLYLALFIENIVPRAIITEWYLNAPSTKEFKFYLDINRPESNTSKTLIQRFQKLDPSVSIIVHSAYLDDMIHEKLPVRLIQKGEPLRNIIEALEESTSVRHSTVKVNK